MIRRQLLGWVATIFLFIVFTVLTILMGVLFIITSGLVWVGFDAWRGIKFVDSVVADSGIRAVEVIKDIFAVFLVVWIEAFKPNRFHEYEEMYEAMAT